MKRIASRYRKALILLVILLAGVFAWRMLQPETFRLMASSPTFALQRPLVSQAGFLLYEGESQFALYDWHDGHLLWRVTAAVPSSTIPWNFQNNRDDSYSTYVLSYDGHYLATASVQTTGILVQIWQDGTLTGDHLFSYQQTMAMPHTWNLAVNNMGQAFFTREVWYNRDLPSARIRRWMDVLQGSHIIARGEPAHDMLLTKDGSLVVLRGKVYAVHIANGKVTFPLIGQADSNFRLLPHGMLLGTNGSICTADGFVSGPDSQRQLKSIFVSQNALRYYDDQALSPTTSWHVSYLPSKIPRDNNMTFHVFNPESGDSWDYRESGNIINSFLGEFIVSADGRFVLHHRNYIDTTDSIVGKYGERFPFLQWAHSAQSREAYEILERPGKLRARFVTLNPKTINTHTGNVRLFTGLLGMSPDGHSIIIGADTDYTWQNQERMVALYRW